MMAHMQRRTKSERADVVRRAAARSRLAATSLASRMSSNAFDDVAAEILALDRRRPGVHDDAALCAARRRPTSLRRRCMSSAARPGDARAAAACRLRPDFSPAAAARIELSEHARAWIERIWAPLWKDGSHLLDDISGAAARARRRLPPAGLRDPGGTDQAATHLARRIPASPARRSHLRGGLSPAALRRVQLFVEGNLGAPDPSRTTSPHARASARTTSRAPSGRPPASTPRAFVEQRRIERAKTLLTRVHAVARRCGRRERISHAEPADLDLQTAHRLHARRVPARPSRPLRRPELRSSGGWLFQQPVLTGAPIHHATPLRSTTPALR